MNTASIYEDFRTSRFLWIILCIGMLPLVAKGYCMYVLILLLPYVMIKKVPMTKTSFLVFLFGACYFITLLANGKAYTGSSIVFDAIYPIVMFQSGIIAVQRCKNANSPIVLCAAMAVCLAGPAIYYNITDAVDTGQIVNPLRAVTFGEDESRSATGYGMMLAICITFIGLALIPASEKTEKRIKLILIVASIGALFSTIHLINRTGLVIGALSILAMVLKPPFTPKRVFYSVIALALLIGIVTYYLTSSNIFSEATEMYEMRNSGDSMSTYGDRSGRWIAGVGQLITKPFGNPNGLYWKEHYNYAHNLWLDAGLKGGILCFILLVILTVIQFKNIISLIKTDKISRFFSSVAVLICFGLFLQNFVEPVIDGLPQFFFYFIFFIAVIQRTNKKLLP